MRGEPGLVGIEAAVVDREVEGVALVQAVVLACGAVAVAGEVFQLRHHAHAFRRQELQRAAHDLGVGLAEVAAVEQVLEIALIAVDVAGQLEVQLVLDQRTGDHRLGRKIARTTPGIHRTFIEHAEIATEIGRRIAGVDQHRAAGGVAPVEDALRPARNFERTQVEHVEHQPVVHPDIYAVDEHAHGRVDRRDRAVHAQATDREIRGPARGAHLIERDVGRAVGERLDIAHLQRLQRLRIERGDCHRNVLDVLDVLLLGGGHDDFGIEHVDHRLPAPFVLRFGRSLRVGASRARGEQRQRAQPATQHSTHDFPVRYRHSQLPVFLLAQELGVASPGSTGFQSSN